MMHLSKFIVYGLLFALYPFITEAQPPFFEKGSVSQDKIEYCTMLVHRYGHLSQKINKDYYGTGVKRPKEEKWSITIKKPGLFSDNLFINFKQTTKEKYNDFEHYVSCMWGKNNEIFEFVIHNHYYSTAPFCTRGFHNISGSKRFFFDPILCP